MTELQLDVQKIVFRFPTGRRNYLYFFFVQNVSEAKSLAFQLGTEAVSLAQSGRKMKLAIRPN